MAMSPHVKINIMDDRTQKRWQIFYWRIEKAIRISIEDCRLYSSSLFFSPAEREIYNKQLLILKELEQQVQIAKEKLIETTKI